MTTETANNTISSGKYLCFALGQERFAIPLLSIKEVVAMPETTKVPYTPAHFLGIMNLRGQVISIFDLRLKLGLKVESTSETAVIICDFNPLCFGVVVNSVDSVLNLTADQIGPKPDIESRINTDFISGVIHHDQKLVLLLNLTKALNVEDMMALKRANEAKKTA